MIRKAYCAAAVTVLLLSVAPSVLAQARDNSWEVGYFGGANLYANQLKIENAFTGFWREPFDQRLAERCDEPGIALVAFGVPMLR